MNFLCDVHISLKLVKHLEKLGHTALHVNSLPSKWHSTDSEICRLADQKELIVITKDEDFRNSFLLNQTPKKLVRITLGNISNQDLIEILTRNLPLIAELNTEKGFYLELGGSAVVYTI
jgi:predicted nuclease of predicted toxin-antitoxin system